MGLVTKLVEAIIVIVVVVMEPFYSPPYLILVLTSILSLFC